MRNRQSKFKAGGASYDYEYENTGIDITLEKANALLDFTKEYAQQSAIAQTLKNYVLLLCSKHYYKYYQVRTITDELITEQNIPLDMKEEEINPSIKRFNNELNFQQTKQSLDRYSQGLPPKFIRFFKLDLIDESVDKYIDIYTNLHTQLTEIDKIRMGGNIEKDGKYLYKLIYDYYTEEHAIKSTEEGNESNNNDTSQNKEDADEEELKKQQDTKKQAEKIIKENKRPMAEGFLNIFAELVIVDILLDEIYETKNISEDEIQIYGYWIDESQDQKHNDVKIYFKRNKHYYSNAIGYNIENEKISILYKIEYKKEISKAELQEDIKKMESLLKTQLNDNNKTLNDNISKLERYEYI